MSPYDSYLCLHVSISFCDGYLVEDLSKKLFRKSGQTSTVNPV